MQDYRGKSDSSILRTHASLPVSNYFTKLMWYFINQVYRLYKAGKLEWFRFSISHGITLPLRLVKYKIALF